LSTAAADGLIHNALDVISALASFEEESARPRGGATGHVRIGTGPYPACLDVVRDGRTVTMVPKSLAKESVASAIAAANLER
jgi:hypothetical protein